ncbi:hypothetical protein HHK36_003707 [Tetracentron sinense]|uniref:N-acetyltransferase domain-containing protein n=1 Tax=Tetracentron sinense TaxID=13715 RepID=A0A834ZNR4_TETSI|nr:hypothetical protein HHK36_003707 [Tetracentron sinense]
MGTSVIVELSQNSKNWADIIEEISRLEKKIFPKHESLARSFHEDLKKKNCGLLYSDVNGEVAGYVMYSWPSSLFASISKLAASVEYSSIAEEKGKPVRVPNSEEEYDLLIETYLNGNVVKENYRRQGHGEALLKAAIQKCRTRNIQRICLYVDPSRNPAMILYQKLGFQVDNLIESYYSSDRNAYRMYLDFGYE